MAALAAAYPLVQVWAEKTVPEADEGGRRRLRRAAAERPYVHARAFLDGGEEIALFRPQLERRAEDLPIVTGFEQAGGRESHAPASASARQDGAREQVRGRSVRLPRGHAEDRDRRRSSR